MKKNESLYAINKDNIKLTVDRIIYNKKYYIIIKLSENNIQKCENIEISFKTINTKKYNINLSEVINEINNHLFRQSNDELLLLSDIYISEKSNTHIKIYLNQDNYEISLKLFNNDVLLDTIHINPNINIKDFIN